MPFDSPRIVQPGGRGWLRWLIGLGIVGGLLLVAGWARYQPAAPKPVAVEIDVSGYEARIRDLEQRLSESESARQALQEQNVALARASQIDREATRLARQEIKGVQQERRRLEEELAFLRGIVSNGVKRSDGLYIQGFQLLPGSGPGLFRYRFTVSQSLKNTGQATGWIYLELEGESGGDAISLPLQQLTPDKQDRLKMRFRHFQDVQGVLSLPEGFQPSSLVVEIKPTTKSLSSVKKRFDWLVSKG